MTTVTCATCTHFRPDPIGNGGIGQCAIRAYEKRPRWGEPPLYPNAKRKCAEYAGRQP